MSLDVGKCLGFDLATNQRVRWLKGGDGSDWRDACHLLGVEIGDANPTYLSGLLQLQKCLPTLFNILIGFRPMDLIQIDRVDSQTTKRRLALPSNRLALQRLHDLPIPIPATLALGEDIRARSAVGCQCLGDHLFTMP